MSIKLDLSKFKHVKSDEHMTTLAHEKDGHTITLSHKSLSKPNQEQLAALAKMGKAEEDEPKARVKDADIERKDRPDMGYGRIQYKANGGEIPDVDRPQAIELARYEGDSGESGITKGFNSVTKAIKDKNASNAAAQEEESEYAKGGRVKYAEGDQVEVPDYLKPNSQVQQPQQMPAININVGGQPAQQVQPPMQQPGQLSDQDKASLSTLTQDKSNSLDGIPELNKNSVSPEQAVMSKEDKSVTGGLPGWTAGAMANSPVIDSRQQPPMEQQPPAASAMDQDSPAAGTATSISASPHSPKTLNTPAVQAQTQAPPVDPAHDYVKEDQAWAQDLKNGHITPKTYQSMFNSKDTLGKIGTIFGLLVSGIGSGLTGKSNMLMDMMGKEIEQDIEAQKTSKSNALNFHNYVEQHSMNEAQKGHMALQDQVTRDAFKQQVASRAAFQELMNKTMAMPEGPLKQQAMQTLGMISQGLDAKSMNAADMLKAKQGLLQGVMGNGQPGDNEQQFQHQNQVYRMSGREDLAKDNESKHIPGVPGRASVPLTSENREAVNSGITLDRKLNDFVNWTKKHSGSLDPKAINEGKAMAAGLQGAYRQATNGGVYKASEQDFIGNIIHSDPTAFFNKVRVLPQLKAVQDDNRAQLDQHLKSLGFQGYQSNLPQDNSPVKGADGRMYVKSADGKFMVPVK